MVALTVDDTIMESLENDGVSLQNMATSKHVQANGLFQAAVMGWQRRLGAVDAVLGLWNDAQRKWQVGLVVCRLCDCSAFLYWSLGCGLVYTHDQRALNHVQALESIFLGSADIRAQLPADSARFDSVNTDFKDLMKAAPSTTLVVEACCLTGRRERLEAILRQLELCEKALQEYLETKRLAFPRFYFVSPADLLDILARGTDPHAIEK
jgi:dynein heavy chain